MKPMPGVRASVGINARPSAEQVVGRWWVPGRESASRGGVLEPGGPEGAGRLRVFGALTEDEEEDITTIYGFCSDIGEITVCDPRLEGRTSRSRATSAADHEVTEERWAYSAALAGEHLHAGSSTTFRSATLTTTLLPSWVDEPRPVIVPELRGSRLELQIPDAVRIPVEGGDAALTWTHTERGGRHLVEAISTPWLSITVSEPLTLAELIATFVRPVLSLLTFLNGTADELAELSVAEQPSPPAQRHSVLLQAPARASEHAHPPEPTFRHQDVGDRLPVVVEAWLELHRRKVRALADYLATKFTPHMSAEERLVATMRAIEGFHRSQFGGERMPAPEYDALVDRIVEQLSTEEKRIVRDRLRFGNEPTQKQRLDDMIERAGDEVAARVRGAKRFSRKVVDTRNALTHLGPSASQVLSGDLLLI